MKFQLLAAFLLVSSLALGEEPKAVIIDSNGGPPPTSIDAGETLFLSAAKAIAGQKPKSIVWVVTPKERSFRTYGREIAISTGKKACDITILQIAAMGDESDWTSITIHVNGDAPGPGPGPGPIPPPEPTSPFVDLVQKNLKPLLDGNPTAKSDKLLLAALAAAYTQAADEVTTGKLTTTDALLDRTFALTHTVLGARFDALWKGPVRLIEQELQKLGDTGKLPDVKSHVAIWQDVAKGITIAINR